MGEALNAAVRVMYLNFLPVLLILAVLAGIAFLFALFGNKLVDRVRVLRVVVALLIGIAYGWLFLGILHEISHGDALDFTLPGTTLEIILNRGIALVAALLPTVFALAAALTNDFTAGKAFAVLLLPLLTAVVMAIYIFVAGVILIIVGGLFTMNHFISIIASIVIYGCMLGGPGTVVVIYIRR